MISLPLSQKTSHFFFDIDLEETTYRFEFHYNERESIWYMNIRDTDDTAIVTGIVVALGSDLLAPWHHLGVPPGFLVALDTSEKDLDAKLGDLGERVQVYYIESTEV